MQYCQMLSDASSRRCLRQTYGMVARERDMVGTDLRHRTLTSVTVNDLSSRRNDSGPKGRIP